MLSVWCEVPNGADFLWFSFFEVMGCALCRHAAVQREVKDLEKGIAHLHNCMARYNALMADSAARKVQLVNENFHLETKIGHELKVCPSLHYLHTRSHVC